MELALLKAFRLEGGFRTCLYIDITGLQITGAWI